MPERPTPPHPAPARNQRTPIVRPDYSTALAAYESARATQRQVEADLAATLDPTDPHRAAWLGTAALEADDHARKAWRRLRWATRRKYRGATPLLELIGWIVTLVIGAIVGMIGVGLLFAAVALMA